MPFSSEHIAELNLLARFESPSSMAGIKVHSNQADPETVAAAERLYRKGLITQKDGGYLTSQGCEALEHTQKLQGILSSEQTNRLEL